MSDSQPFPRKRKPSIFDVVKKTGFSHGTVSRALNDRYGVNPRTKSLILKAARELGYRASASARSFKMGVTRRWGILLPHLQNPYYSELFEALDLAMKPAGLKPYLALTHYDLDVERELLMHWASGETDALIVDPLTSPTNTETFASLHEWGVPVILLHAPVHPAFDWIMSGSSQVLERALSHLYGLGHRRIGFLSYDYRHYRESMAFVTYESFLRTHGLAFDELLVGAFPYNANFGGLAMTRWKDPKQRPTAVLCFNDAIAISLHTACRSMGLRVPADMSIIGRDDVVAASPLGLSTIRTERQVMANAIVQTLQRRIEHPEAEAQRVLIPSEFIVRESVGPPPAQAG